MILAAIVTYFLLAFVVYSYSDFIKWSLDLAEAEITAHKAEAEFLERLMRDGPPEQSDSKELSAAYNKRAYWSSAALAASRARVGFEFAIPVAFAVFSLILLVRAAA